MKLRITTPPVRLHQFQPGQRIRLIGASCSKDPLTIKSFRADRYVDLSNGITASPCHRCEEIK